MMVTDTTFLQKMQAIDGVTLKLDGNGKMYVSADDLTTQDYLIKEGTNFTLASYATTVSTGSQTPTFVTVKSFTLANITSTDRFRVTLTQRNNATNDCVARVVVNGVVVSAEFSSGTSGWVTHDYDCDLSACSLTNPDTLEIQLHAGSNGGTAEIKDIFIKHDIAKVESILPAKSITPV